MSDTTRYYDHAWVTAMNLAEQHEIDNLQQMRDGIEFRIELLKKSIKERSEDAENKSSNHI